METRRPTRAHARNSPIGACATPGSRAPPWTANSCTACRCGVMSRSPTKCSTGGAAWCSAKPTTGWWCRPRYCIACSPHRPPESLTDRHSMIMHRPDPAAAIRSLRSAAPYIRMYKGKTFVVKAGGGVFADPAAVHGLIEQIAILHYFGVRVVFVHGGGPQLTEITEQLGVPTRMVQGRRVTDQKAIDATSMVLNGLINTRLLAYCREMNIDAIGISGVDAGLIRAHKRPPVKVDGETVDYGFVGDIDQIDTTVLTKLLDNGLMPVVSPLSADENGTLLNINADTV